MIINSLLPVTRMLVECPKCGRDAMTTENKVNGLHIGDPIVTRTCQCGFHLEYDVRQGTARNKIQKAIDQAVRADMIRFCIEGAKELEGVEVDREEFEKLNYDELNDRVAFYDYLWTK